MTPFEEADRRLAHMHGYAPAQWVPWVECCGERWLDFWALVAHTRTHGRTPDA